MDFLGVITHAYLNNLLVHNGLLITAAVHRPGAEVGSSWAATGKPHWRKPFFVWFHFHFPILTYSRYYEHLKRVKAYKFFFRRIHFGGVCQLTCEETVAEPRSNSSFPVRLKSRDSFPTPFFYAKCESQHLTKFTFPICFLIYIFISWCLRAILSSLIYITYF